MLALKALPEAMVQTKKALPGEDDTQGSSLLDYLEKLRWHILRSLLVVSLLGIGLFLFQGWLFDKVIFAPARSGFPTYRLACWLSHHLALGETICFEPPVFRTQAIGFGEAFITSITVSFIAGLILAFPYLVWELSRFFNLWLAEKGKRRFSNLVLVCSLLFTAGVLFGYFVLAPFSISWLIGYTVANVENTPTLSSYINFMIIFTLPMGVIFQLPVISFLLARIGLLDAVSMRYYRRHAVVVILSVAALITPTVDGLTQCLVALPLYLLYEASIGIVGRAARLYEEEITGNE